MVSMVVPTYNERERLEHFVRTLVGVLQGAGLHSEIIIVDDNSPDGTGEVAEGLRASCRCAWCTAPESWAWAAPSWRDSPWPPATCSA
jgi:GT2 family glycosyltransferase